ncbi:hypothetical protein Tco_1101547 [Tanacetum coccineum]
MGSCVRSREKTHILHLTKVSFTPPWKYGGDFPIAHVTAPPGTRRRAVILIQPEEAIPLGRLYRTHLNGLRRVMTARKRVRPLPTRRLARRRVSPHSSDHHSSSASSSLDHSPVHSSSFDTPNQAFCRWRATPLSTPYPPTTSESSSRDFSSERSLHSYSHSARPSRKRSRSPVDSVPSSLSVEGSLVPTHADLLPPRKRFRDSYSSEASMEEDIEVGTVEAEVGLELVIGDEIVVRYRVGIDPRDVREDTEEFEAKTSAGDTVELGIDPVSAPVADEESEEPAGGDSSGTRDGSFRSVEDMQIDLSDVVRDFYHHMSEIRVNRVIGIETIQRQLEAGQLIASGERASMVERIESLRLENLKVRALLGVERDRVDSLRLHMSRSQEEFRQIRKDCDDVRRRSRRLESFVERRMTPEAIKELVNRRVEEALAAYEETHAANALEAERDENDTGNGNNGGNNGYGTENRNVNGRGDRPVARECTYQDFMKCQPLNFKGTEGVVGLIRWCEKMKTVFHISNCPERYQVKHATCTLLGSALTWWNSYKRTIGTDATYALSWRELLKLMTEVYCLRNEVQKMETELWNLSVKNNDMAT